MFNLLRGSQINFITLQQAQQKYHGDFNESTPQLETFWRYYKAKALATTPVVPYVHLAATLVTRTALNKAITNVTGQEVDKKKGAEKPTESFEVTVAKGALLSGVVAGVTHPIAVVQTWQITQDIPRGLLETWKLMRFEKKNMYDGLALDVVLTASSEFLMRITQKQLNAIVSRHWSPSFDAKQATTRKARCSASWDEFVLQNSISSAAWVLVRMLLYPLYTVRYHLEGQGASIYNPIRYKNTLDALQSIWNEEGLKGFYKGLFSLGWLLSFDQFSLIVSRFIIAKLIDSAGVDTLEPIDQLFAMLKQA